MSEVRSCSAELILGPDCRMESSHLSLTLARYFYKTSGVLREGVRLLDASTKPLS